MVNQFLSFIQHSPSAFHAAAELCRQLEEAGCIRLNEYGQWNIEPGKRYFVTRNQSAVIAFDVPECGLSHFQIVSSHSDSPCFKLKPSCEDVAAGRMIRLNVERYGGMIMSSWFDRPLSVAGRVIVKTETGFETRLADLGRDALLIPNMPIHFNRDVNDGYKYNPQVDLLPLYADGAETGRLMKDVAQSCGVNTQDIVSADLFLYSRMPGSVWGAENEFFSCPRIDDLECAYTSLAAFLAAKPDAHINVLAVFETRRSAVPPSRARIPPSWTMCWPACAPRWALPTARSARWWPPASWYPLTTLMPCIPLIRNTRTGRRLLC